MPGFELYEIVSPIVVLVIGVVASFLTKLLHTKIKNETLAGIMARLNATVWDEVAAAEQVFVKGIKAARDADSDGGVEITEKEGLKIRADVMARIKENMGPKGLAKLGTILGLDGDGVAKMIESKIEAAVFGLRLP